MLDAMSTVQSHLRCAKRYPCTEKILCRVTLKLLRSYSEVTPAQCTHDSACMVLYEQHSMYLSSAKSAQLQCYNASPPVGARHVTMVPAPGEGALRGGPARRPIRGEQWRPARRLIREHGPAAKMHRQGTRASRLCK